MSKEPSQQVLEYRKLRNTYQYTILSDCGDDSNGRRSDAGDFDFLINPFPFPDHNSSSRAIFKLCSFYVIKQGTTDGDRLTGDLDVDSSGFSVEINGLGITNMNSQVRGCELTNKPNFTIINKYSQIFVAADNTSPLQRVSGDEYYGEPVLCSNPVGSLINVKVFDLDDNLQIDTGIFKSVMTFSIEILDNETTQN